MSSQLVPGYDGPRPAREHEFVQAAELLDLVLYHSNPRGGHDWCHVYRTDNRENIGVIVWRGSVVHVTAMYVHDVRAESGLVRVMGLSGVSTHPEHRGHGLGSQMMLYCLERMRALGVHLGLLWTPIPDWYRKFGWEWAGTEKVFFFDRGNIALLPDPADYEIRKAAPEEQSQALELLNAGLGGGRTAHIDNILLATQQPLTLVAVEGGRVIAFVRLHARRVMEHGGRAEAVAALVRAAFAHLDDPTLSTTARSETGSPVLNASLRLSAPARSALVSHFEGMGIPQDQGYVGMVRIVDAPGLLAQCGADGLTLQQEGDTVYLAAGGHTLAMDIRTWAKQLLGPERPYPLADAALLPRPFYVWPWDRV